MATKRRPTLPTTDAIDQFCAAFDDLFARYEERTAVRHYLIGLLLPREHNKTIVELAAIVPGANRQSLHHFMHDAPWDAEALNRRRLQQWQVHPYLRPHAGGVLIVDETGDPKRGHCIMLAAQQYLGKLGHVANGVVAVTSHWTDGSRHVPLGVKPYRPAGRLPKSRKDPDFHTKPELGWQLIEEARAAGIPFRLVVADSVYGENLTLEARLYTAQIPYIMGLRPSHGTWQEVDDPAHPPAFTPRPGGAAPPARGVAAHGALRQPWQGAGALYCRVGTRPQLRADQQHAADCRDPRSNAAQARVHLVSGHLLAIRAGQRRAGLRDLPLAGLDRALLQTSQA